MNHAQFWGGAAAPYEIEQSLRFDGSSNLLWTPSSTGDSVRKWTISVWVKQNYATGSTAKYMISAGPNTGTDTIIYPYTYDVGGISGQYYFMQGPPTRYVATLDSFRDESAWYHFVFQSDADNATTNDKLKIFVNGERVSTNSPGNPPVTQDTYWNSTNQHRIGGIAGLTNWTGYMAEFHSVDNQLVDPDQFGEYDDNGVWRPIEYKGTHGSNGFYLKFDPTATNGIGHDHSGNGNHWTPTGFSTTAGITYDVMSDTPTTNYATLNPLTGDWTSSNSYGREISDGNLRTYNPGTKVGTIHYSESTTATQFVRSADGGVYMWESTFDDKNGSISISGYRPLENIQGTPNSALFYDFALSGFGTVDIGYLQTGTIVEQGVQLTAGDVVTCVVDFDNNTVAFYVNGTRNGYITGCDFTTAEFWGPSHSTWTLTAPYANQNVNLGQQPFQYTPVSGAKPWSTAELPAPAISDPSEHFQTVLDTGANILSSAQSTFSNGLWWVKDRANTNQHQLVDSVRGGNLALTTPSLGTDTTYSAPSGNSVAWSWNAPNAWSNSAGSNGAGIASNGYRNLDAGFSIVSYTGTGSSETVFHGLNNAPRLMIVKNRDSAEQWHVYHADVGRQRVLFLDSSAAVYGPYPDFWDSTNPTNTVFYVGTSNGTNQNGSDMIAYCWSEVPGYSLINTYVGNGVADGPMIYTGFRTAFVLIKGRNTNDWVILDSERVAYNPTNRFISSNSANPENTPPASETDFLSNGFKIRTTWSGLNSTNQEYIFAAFAKHPLGGDGVSPVTAR